MTEVNLQEIKAELVTIYDRISDLQDKLHFVLGDLVLLANRLEQIEDDQL